MNEKYIPSAVESAAQAHWAARDAYRVVEDPRRPKFYACSMLPYPSGILHMGHVRNYTINDMLARHLRMKGMNVLMPMGWDAFGLPAENAAIKNKVPPAKWTYDNIAHMKGQMQAIGLAIDWSREVTTCKPDYYKWNQWLFLKMLEAGIAERRTQVVNWDPVDQTVLANEQVIDGRGWRSGAIIEKREIPGYYLKITHYADELLDQVAHHLSGWPERVKLMQEHWIGKSEGLRFAFTHDIRGSDGQPIQGGRMYVFTTRADTIMGVTFCAVAPEHPLAAHAARSDAKVAAFIERCKQGGTTEAELALREKEGLDTGLTVTHPLTGAAVPLWVGNYVLMSYGDGAVMGVPAHDERDFAFANKYGLPIKQVIERDTVCAHQRALGSARGPDRAYLESQLELEAPANFSRTRWQDWYARKDRIECIDSGRTLDTLAHKEAVNAVATALATKGLGEMKTTWRLRDWGISRQRYWGTPIPIIHCTEHGAVPVPEQDLPVVLPEDCIPDGSGNPLNKREDFLKCVCPTCGKPARRETDTMDTFVDSAWYYMRYCDPKLDNAMVGAGTRYWMPMDQYIGGIEHAILHLLYARFWTKVMRDMNLVPASLGEPFMRLMTQGMVLNEAFVRTTEQSGREYFWAADLTIVRDEHQKVVSAIAKRDGLPVDFEGWTTMSKSKNNGVDPEVVIERYGADTARLFGMFAAPPDQSVEWTDSAVEGAHRYLRRVWNYCVRHGERIRAAPELPSATSPAARSLRRELHALLRQVSYDYDRMQYNTVVSGAMKMLNALEAFEPGTDADEAAALREGVSILLRTLYPACPHLTHGLWAALGYEQACGDLLDAAWPQVDEQALVQDEIELVLQISGKLRGKLRVSAAADAATIEAAALATPEFARFSEGRPVKLVKVVPGRLVNVVV